MGAKKGRVPWNKGHVLETDIRLTRKNKKEPLDKEWLYDQYITHHKNTVQIGRDINSSAGFVYGYLKLYGIPVRSKSEAMKGVPKSEETKEKCRQAAVNRVVSDATKSKHRNYVPTEETKQKISDSQTGKPVPDNIRYKISKSKMNHPVSENSKVRSSVLNRGNSHVKFGIIIEDILCKYFTDTTRMPHDNPGFDFFCSKNLKIDAKGSIKHKDGCWVFYIDKNVIADYFACVGCTTNELDDIEPVHFWLIPGHIINDRRVIVIRDTPKSLLRWEQYERPVNKIIKCCDVIKSEVS